MQLFEIYRFIMKMFTHIPYNSLQCRRILGGRNLVRVRNVVVAAIFDFMTVEDGESRNSNPYGRCEGERRKGGRGRGENSLLSPRRAAPSPLPLTRPISSALREVSTWRFREQIARSKKTPALQARSCARITASFHRRS